MGSNVWVGGVKRFLPPAFSRKTWCQKLKKSFQILTKYFDALYNILKHNLISWRTIKYFDAEYNILTHNKAFDAQYNILTHILTHLTKYFDAQYNILKHNIILWRTVKYFNAQYNALTHNVIFKKNGLDAKIWDAVDAKFYRERKEN